jgi:hypothetical protein
MSRWGKSSFIITSALLQARELWRYGEPDLAEKALALSPDEVLDLGARAGQLMETGDDHRIWPESNGGSWMACVLAAIEMLEGVARPPRRRRRLSEAALPTHLQATSRELLDAQRPVDAVWRARVGYGE